MRTLIAASAMLVATGVVPVLGQASSDPTLAPVPPTPPASRNVTATGRTMPPSGGRTNSSVSNSTEVEMIKAQKAAEARNKAWDTKMRRTMGTICTGC